MSVLRFRNNETGEWQEIVTIKGEPGKDGRTPVKGVDYFDGAPGKDGADGYTPVKGVDYFDGEPGKDGTPGQDGKDYILTAADKQEIASMIEGGGGEGGGNANVVVLKFNGDTATDETLAILQEYYAYYRENGTLQPITFVMHSSWYAEYYFYVTKIVLSQYEFKLYGGQNEQNNLYGYGFSSHMSNGSFDNFYMYASSPSDADNSGWTWCDAYGSSSIYISEYSHVKLAYTYEYDSSYELTLDVSTTHGNTFGEECGSYYSVVYYNQNGGSVTGKHLYLDWSCYLETSIDGYILQGYYYQ